MAEQYSNKKIKDLLNKVVSTETYYSKQCVVESVDEENFLCDVQPIDGTPIYFDVMLSPTQNSTNVQIPNVGSVVFVHFLDGKTPYVTSMDSVSKSIVRSTDENAEHVSSLKEALTNFATDMQSALDVVTFNTPQGPTTPGMLEPGKTQVQTAVDDFIAELDSLFKE
tara:strand:- start:320 stop:820 length:501 start_codon:yes stop_codon:yes gene_type:complete